MDIWKFYDVTHRHQLICNPTSREKLEQLVELLRLPAGASVVDIASGKGEFLVRLAETYGVSGVGIDASPHCTRDASAKLTARVPQSGVVFREMDGAAFVPDKPHSFALASCIGASWVFGGHGKTIDALLGFVRPGGWIVVGEPFWRREPAAEYLEALGMPRSSFTTHAENAAAGEGRGLELAYTLVSSEDDWDRYEGLQWFGVSEYARSHPEDPDLPELLERIAKQRTDYLRWGRDTLGWAIYVFRQRI
ncbi:MAG: cyclopropane-fatty-acyl-phospholipid synthase family protein [Candidatus Eisenbacteria bacterium]